MDGNIGQSASAHSYDTRIHYVFAQRIFCYPYLLAKRHLLSDLRVRPHPPSPKTGDKKVDLFKKVRVELDLIKKKHVQHHADDADRPIKYPCLCRKPHGPNGEYRPEKLNITHLILKHHKKGVIDIKKPKQCVHNYIVYLLHYNYIPVAPPVSKVIHTQQPSGRMPEPQIMTASQKCETAPDIFYLVKKPARGF